MRVPAVQVNFHKLHADFDKPAGEGERIPAIAPLQRMNFQTKVSVPREQMRIFEAGGRKVFVPLIGFNAYYRWGSGEGQTSVSFLLGRDTAGEKMSPFRVDIGPRTFRGLGAREHTLDEATAFVEAFLATPFSGNPRHARRIGQLGDYEKTRKLPELG